MAERLLVLSRDGKDRELVVGVDGSSSCYYLLFKASYDISLVACRATCYAYSRMIKSWKHKGLKVFYSTGRTSGIQATHAKRLKLLLQLLNAATQPDDMNLPGFFYHPLKGNKNAYFAVTVNKNWRLIFKFEEGDAILVDYLDYH